MTRLAYFRETIATYRRHGWEAHSVMMCAATRAELPASANEVGTTFEGVDVRDAEFDAVWFSRQSGAPGRMAWELRLIGDAPYALFEVFEPDDPEEDRADVRREMEARLRDYVGGKRAGDAGLLP